ncbi:glucan biosynthesis protein [Pelagibacterium sp.]|uniref:glucan biosynthesis protein n=1 Tax=Pelagibacterium sp. TaxID=1967288 RepID=UPI003A8D12DF
MAQEADAVPAVAEAEGQAPAGQEFSFDLLTQWMRERSAQPYTAPVSELPANIADLNYDDYRHIQFRAQQARWREENSQFHVHAFHPGWLYSELVDIFEVQDGVAQPMGFSTDDFQYYGHLADVFAEGEALPGAVGFRLNNPLNRLDVFDELIAFVGASYFRALGRGNFYGLSARGLAINTGIGSSEEFPRFSQFYLEKPQPGQRNVIVHAALDSQSVTGAFRFDIRPGEETVIDVTARLFFRAAVEQVGVAPMTSMFLYAENNRSNFDDYRPQVHDSNGLLVLRDGGDVLWRALNNPPRLASSYLSESNPRGFGLIQRDRDFGDYQDPEARYERRPSLMIEPIGDWGPGNVRLVEIPSDLEVNDNIVAFWVPEQKVSAGEEREYHYRMRWGDISPEPEAELAYVYETRTGLGGVSGVENAPDLRKFVVDFRGGLLAGLAGDQEDIEALFTVTGGEVAGSVLKKVSDDTWRLVLDVELNGATTVELVAHVAGFGRKLTETWLYQWMLEA